MSQGLPCYLLYKFLCEMMNRVFFLYVDFDYLLIDFEIEGEDKVVFHFIFKIIN